MKTENTIMYDNWIYENTSDNRARFILGEKGENTLVCVGINPSTAIPDHLDNTLKQVKRMSKTFGYDSWIMINIYPQIATNPNDLHTDIEKELHLQNLEHIKLLLKNKMPDIWAAWGSLILKRYYLLDCLKEIYQLSNNKNWYSAGKLTEDIHPRHPLYNGGIKLEKFDMKKYLKSLCK